MPQLKLNFFNKIELWCLGINSKRVSKWINNKNVLSFEKEKEVEEQWEKLGVRIRKVNNYFDRVNDSLENFDKKKITRVVKTKKFKKNKKELEDIRGFLLKLKKQRNKGEIFFNSFFKFMLFTIWFSFTFFGNFGIKNILHEREHANFYKKSGIDAEYGWKKVFNKTKKDYFYRPFISVSAPREIYLKSLKHIKNPSFQDKFKLKLVKKYNAN